MRNRALLCLTLALAACDMAPDYRAPAGPLADHFKEAEGWLPAQPQDDRPRGSWWVGFGDKTLDELEAKMDRDSPTLAQAMARYDQARAAAEAAGAPVLPQLGYNGGAQRQKKSKEAAIAAHPTQFNDFTGQVALSWEIDLWGRVRNSAKAAEQRAEASAADLGAVKLALQGQLASAYITVRELDLLQALYDRRAANDKRGLELARFRHERGAASAQEVDAALTQSANSTALALNNKAARAQWEHAIAALIGEEAGKFSLPAGSLPSAAPSLAVSQPSVLLQRRPDVAAAERRMAAANADIGVARAAYFPVLDLGALFGADAAKVSNLARSASTLWAFGASASGPLFDGGLRDATVDLARAKFEEAAGSYRQTVVTALREAEDSIALKRSLDVQAAEEHAAAEAARHSLRQTVLRHDQGAASARDLIAADDATILAEAAEADTTARQLLASISLITALGGNYQ